MRDRNRTRYQEYKHGKGKNELRDRRVVEERKRETETLTQTVRERNEEYETKKWSERKENR